MSISSSGFVAKHLIPVCILSEICLPFQEKLFLTPDTLQSQLDDLQTEGENMGRMDEQMPDSPRAEIKVAEMNAKKLTLKISRVSSPVLWWIWQT